MEIFPAARLDQQQSKYGPKRQVQQHCGGKCWWFVARTCASRRVNGGHASTVAPPRWSLIAFDTQHGRYPHDISPAAYCHLQPPQNPPGLHRTRCKRSPAYNRRRRSRRCFCHPPPTRHRSLRYRLAQLSLVRTHTPTSVPFFVPSFSYSRLFLFLLRRLIWMIFVQGKWYTEF